MVSGVKSVVGVFSVDILKQWYLLGEHCRRSLSDFVVQDKPSVSLKFNRIVLKTYYII